MNEKTRQIRQAMRLREQAGRLLRESLRAKPTIERLEPRLFLSTTYPLAPLKSPLVGITPPVTQKPAPPHPRTHKPPHKQPDLFPPDSGVDHDAFPLPSSNLQPSSIIATPPVNNLTAVGGSWQSDGPAPIQGGQVPGSGPVSGRLTSIAASPTDSNTIYIGAAGGGVWKTTNGGTSWTPLTDGQPTTVIGALAIAPSNTSVIYAGTGEANNSGDSMYGQGILKSIDGGATWSVVGSAQFFGRTISKIVVDPANANIVYVAVASFAVNGNIGSNSGVWKTTDGGVNWTNTTAASPNFLTTFDAYSDLVMAPGNSSTLYCAIGSYFSGEAANGIYKTTDGGGHWAKLTGFPGGGTTNGRIALAIAPSNASILYASEQSTSTNGLAGVSKSTDGGTTWTPFSGTGSITPTFNYMGGQGWYDQIITVNPTNSSLVYVAGSADATNAVMVTSNGGTSWTGIATGAGNNNGPHADHHAFAFDASGRLLDGNDGGIWRLDNATVGSILWTDLNSNLQLTQFVGVGIASNDATIAFGGAQDNGTSQLNAGFTTWTLREGGDGGYVVVSPNSNSRIYHVAPVASFGTGSFFRRSDSGGAIGTWNSKVSGITSANNANFYPPFVVDPGNFAGSDRLLLGTNQVYVSTNNADSWTAISSPGLNGWNTSNSIDAIGLAPNNVNTIYASAGGKTFVTTNGGTSWTEVDIPGLATIAQIVVDPNNSQIAYAVSSVFNSGNVFRTANGGTTWANISSNLPNSPAYSIVYDSTDGVIYVGNDMGVFSSSNLGSSWNQLGTGLPTTEVHYLQLNKQGVLVAGTYGRGMWQINPPFVINGTAGLDNIYLKADAGNPNLVDYWVNANIAGAPTGTFAKTIGGFFIHGLGSLDTITLDESAGDVLLGQSWLDDVGPGGTAGVNIIGSTGNDNYSMAANGTTLTYANNGGPGRILNLANASTLAFSGNGGADTITSAGATPFTLTLGSTGSESLTVNSGTVLAKLPLNNDALTINNIGGTVNIQVG